MLDWDFCSIAVNAENCTSVGGDRPEFDYPSEVLRYAVWYWKVCVIFLSI